MTLGEWPLGLGGHLQVITTRGDTEVLSSLGYACMQYKINAAHKHKRSIAYLPERLRTVHL